MQTVSLMTVKGVRKMKHFHCPVNAWDCPYYKVNMDLDGKEEYCICTLEDPMYGCDDFYSTWCECVPDDYTDDN